MHQVRQGPNETTITTTVVTTHVQQQGMYTGPVHTPIYLYVAPCRSFSVSSMVQLV
jgi:hypothetical protein